MTSINFEIKSEAKINAYLKILFFAVGFLFFIMAAIYKAFEILYFFGLITIFIALLLHLFSSKKHLKISQDHIEFNLKSCIKEFNKSVSIPFKAIKNVYFLKRQFLIFGGRSPIADADAQRLYNENRIIFVLDNNRSETIMQLGKLSDFKKGFTIIKTKLDELTTKA